MTSCNRTISDTGTITLCEHCDRRALRLIDSSGTLEYARGEDYGFDGDGALTVRADSHLRPGDVVTVMGECSIAQGQRT